MDLLVKGLVDKQQEIMARLDVLNEHIKNLFEVIKKLQKDLDKILLNK